MQTSAGPLVGVVVINWNGVPQSRKCLESLGAAGYQNVRTCLVDNGSTDDSVLVLQREFPAVTVLSLPVNLGYGGGCNAGIEWAKGAGAAYVLLLNNDTVLDPAALETLVERAETLHAAGTPAVLAPKILYASAPSTVWSAGGVLRWPWLERDHLGMGDQSSTHDAAREVAWASGCALFCSTQVADLIGPFDERYFLYMEDVDWCLRARRKGFPVWFVPQARLWHDVSLTTREVDSRDLRYYYARNYYRLAFRHCGPVGRAWASLRLATTLAKASVRCLFFPSYRRDSLYQSQTRAILDFIRGRSGKAPFSNDLPVAPGAARATERPV